MGEGNVIARAGTSNPGLKWNQGRLPRRSDIKYRISTSQTGEEGEMQYSKVREQHKPRKESCAPGTAELNFVEEDVWHGCADCVWHKGVGPRVQIETEIKSAFSSYLEGDVFLIYAKAIWFSTALCKENKKRFY